MLNRWMEEYIEDIDINNIEWISLSYEELGMFLKENYYDILDKRYVSDKIINSSNIIPIGMNYLYYTNTRNDYKYVLGVVKNKRKKYTIISAVSFLDDVYLFNNQEKPITYLCFIEVNFYFRKKGIMQKTCKALCDFIPNNQDIVISKESEMGKKCNSFSTVYNSLLNNYFTVNILREEEVNNKNYKKLTKAKVLKKN